MCDLLGHTQSNNILFLSRETLIKKNKRKEGTYLKISFIKKETNAIRKINISLIKNNFGAM